MRGVTPTALGALCVVAATTGVGAQANRDDIALDAPALAQLLRARHASPFWWNPESEFARVEAELRRSANDGASKEQLLAQMLRLIAIIGDGHTVLASPDRYGQFGIAPFFAELYDDGVFLAEVPAAQTHTLGAEVLAVEGLPISAVLARLRSVVPHATESRFRRWARTPRRPPNASGAGRLQPARRRS